jgi:Fe-S oxidoreductase
MSDRHGLPLLAARTDELSKCAYCPKLCRATCVVSESEPREALTPGGKMTSAFQATREDGPDAERAELAWGCSNCFRCREACDHRNPVAPTLNDARADYVAAGLAPPSIAALLEREPELNAEHEAAAQRLEDTPGVEPGATQALLLGCRYAKVFAPEARAAIRLAVALSGPVRLLRGCCGAWQRAAGGQPQADRARERLAAELGSARRLLVLDPRCALELSELSPVTLVELAARHPERFRRARGAEPVRYHDSCALGRGLGIYDAPRELLSLVTGSKPLELETSREHARCSGAGGALPISMPEVSKKAGQRLADEHTARGGGTLVTSCASSLSRMRERGTAAVDLIALLESGLGDDG